SLGNSTGNAEVARPGAPAGKRPATARVYRGHTPDWPFTHHPDSGGKVMTLRRLTLAALLALLPAAASAQSAGPVIAAASKAMGADSLTSITYSGSARDGAFGQSKSIRHPMGSVNVTQISMYTRTITFGQTADQAALVSRATGTTQPPTVPGTPPPMPGVFNQNITSMQASTNWTQGLNIWTTPWGFLKGAAANNATARQQGGQQIVSFSPSLKS